MPSGYPKVEKKYYGSGPWHVADYYEFLGLVRRRGLDQARESTELLKGNEVRLGGVVYRMKDCSAAVEAHAPKKSSTRHPEVRSTDASAKNRGQTTLF